METVTPSPLRIALLAAVLFLLPTGDTYGEDDVNVFGSREKREGALIGILYDLKQNQALEKMTMDIPNYHRVINEFLSKNWDESVLNRYYRVTQPLYTTQVFIPKINASAAPKAFGVEGIVKPSFWLIHYKGQVTAPSDGEWRFWGWGEEVCTVAINGKLVLLANWKEIKLPDVPFKNPGPDGQKAGRGVLTAGEWFSLKKGDVVDLDVLIGERAGGVFNCFLLIEKKGETYGPPVGDDPLLPVFQLAPFATPQPPNHEKGPQIANQGPIWQVMQ